MSLHEFNRRHEIEVTAYYEGDPQREYGGIVSRSRSSSVTLNILFMHRHDKREVRKENGQRFIEDGFTFQVRSDELTAKSFTITSGRTFITWGSDTYRVTRVKDYSMYRLTQTIQCDAVRLIEINA